MHPKTRQHLQAMERAATEVARRLVALPVAQRDMLIATLEQSTPTEPLRRELGRLIAAHARRLIAQERTRQ